MISHEKKFIFIHIPKTGGTSVSSVLKPYGIVLSGDDNVKSIYYKHARASYMQTILGDTYADYFKFSVVRNPFDWVISNYEFNRGLHRPFLEGTQIKNSNKIPEWAESFSFKEWLYLWLEMFNPNQKQFVTNDSGQVIVEKIIKFENLAKGFNEVCNTLGISLPNNGIPQLRKSPRNQSIESYFDQKLANLLYDKLYEDFCIFEFSRRIPLG